MNAKKLGMILFLVVVMMLGLVACGVTTPTQATTTANNDGTTNPPANTVNVIYMVESDAIYTETIESGTKATGFDLSEMSELGLDFKGWYLAGAEEPFDFETPITALTMLYAKFDFITYTISYNLGTYEGALDAEGKPVASNPNIVEYSTGGIWAEKSNISYTVEKAVVIKPASVPNMVCTWVDEEGKEVTSTDGYYRNLTLTAMWSKAPYINIDFEGMLIHYNDSASGLPALDGTTQIYNNQSGAASRPNAAIQYYYDVDENGNIKQDFKYRVMDMFKNTHNPMYIRNDEDEHGDYFCVILDHDLTDGSLDETHYFDKDGTGLDHKSNGVYAGVYYDCAANEHYNVSALCYLQNMDVVEKTVKLSFDFYFEEGGIYPISFYIRDDDKTYGNALKSGNRTNLAALKPNGDIVIGVDAAGNKNRLTYKNGEEYITTEQVLGKAKVGTWNHIEFTMTLGETGTNYEVTISLNGTVITESALNLYVDDLTWGHANMFMIFGGGTSYAVDALNKDLTYKFDNIKLVGVEE